MVVDRRQLVDELYDQCRDVLGEPAAASTDPHRAPPAPGDLESDPEVERRGACFFELANDEVPLVNLQPALRLTFESGQDASALACCKRFNLHKGCRRQPLAQ